MSELVPGGNLPLPEGVLTIRVGGPFDVSALITDDGGKVRSDGDFVFYNQPAAPGVRLRGRVLDVDPAALRAGAARVTVVVSPAQPGTPPGRLPAPVLHVDSGRDGRPLARFTPPRPQRETALLLAEIYRRGPLWKIRALGQGYADGLAGVARDFGVEVQEDAVRPGPTAPPQARAARTVSTAPGASVVPSPPGTVPADGFVRLVNAARRAAGSPPVAPDPRLMTAAQAHADAMAGQDRLGPEGPDGTSVFQRITAGGYTYLTVGEHLVSGPRTHDGFVEYCLSSEDAAHTLRDPAFAHVGVACASGGGPHGHGSGRGGMYWTAVWTVPLTARGLAGTRAEVVTLTNAARAAAGLRPLTADPLLTTAAQGHSSDMVARDFYAHTSPEGGEPWDRAAGAGSGHRTVGENIACGQRSPAEVVEGWLNSPGHRANILGRGFTHVGIGLAGGGRAGTYWTQLFGG
ncbi:CAP domain-containing protein [Streptomyces sp. NPDC002004]